MNEGNWRDGRDGWRVFAGLLGYGNTPTRTIILTPRLLASEFPDILLAGEQGIQSKLKLSPP